MQGDDTVQITSKDLRFPSSSPLTISYSSDNHFENTELDDIAPELILHHCWEFLSESDILHICQASPLMSAYRSLRCKALKMSKSTFLSLQQALDPNVTPSIDHDRTRIMSQFLLLCDFDFSILVKTLRGCYTSDYLDFKKLDDIFSELSKVPLAEGQPPHDFKRIRHQLHHGFPEAKHFRCKRKDVIARNLYDNHNSISPHFELVKENIAKDIQKSFLICFHRWLYLFIHGLHLSPLGVLIKERYGKLKYRQLNDKSTLILGPKDSGAPNSQLDKKDHKEVPPVHYGTAFPRLCSRIWNMRISFPNERIYLYKDDIVSAFRRCKYNPLIAAAYAFVFDSLLCIPVGALFGPRDSPGWFCMLSELRAFASQHLDELRNAQHDLIDSVNFDNRDLVTLAKAVADTINNGIDASIKGAHITFVDDTIMAELKQHVKIAAAASIYSANFIFGNEPHVDAPVSRAKFMKFFSHYCDCLGIDIDTDLMLAIYPINKRADLAHKISDIITSVEKGSPILVHVLASVLGKLRHAAQILPAGNFLCFHLQEALNAHLFKFGILKGWGKFRTIHISKYAIWSLRLLEYCLHQEDSPIWRRPIGLLVPRDPNETMYSDASTKGLGGYGIHLDLQWRISVANLLGNIKVPSLTSPSSPDDPHINILEFIGIIINIYFAILKVILLKRLSKEYPYDQGFILHCFADNTSALSWLRHSSRSHCTQTRNLAQFLLSMLFHANDFIPINIQGFHVKGINNERADALSRPQLFPTYKDVFEEFSDLKEIPAYRLPSKLIAEIRQCLLSKLIKAPSKKTMINLLKTDVRSLKLTAKNWDSKI